MLRDAEQQAREDARSFRLNSMFFTTQSPHPTFYCSPQMKTPWVEDEHQNVWGLSKTTEERTTAFLPENDNDFSPAVLFPTFYILGKGGEGVERNWEE